LDAPIRRVVVRDGRVGARRHDRVEGGPSAPRRRIADSSADATSISVTLRSASVATTSASAASANPAAASMRAISAGSLTARIARRGRLVATISASETTRSGRPRLDQVMSSASSATWRSPPASAAGPWRSGVDGDHDLGVDTGAANSAGLLAVPAVGDEHEPVGPATSSTPLPIR
jgi:hypothetical protein